MAKITPPDDSGTLTGSKKGAPIIEDDVGDSSTERGDSGAESVANPTSEKKVKLDVKGKAVDKGESVDAVDVDTVPEEHVTSGSKPKPTGVGASGEAEQKETDDLSVPASSTTFANFKESLLCYKGKPLTVAFVARLMSTFFRVGENQQPARCANVMFKFMRDVDDYACRALLYEKAKPVVKDKMKKDMQRLDNAKLYPNDIVLLQCQVHRFTAGSRYIGSTWETRLRLVGIVKLFEAPPETPQDPISEDESTRATNPVMAGADDADFEF
ncbi:hypothetical protein EIP86_005225 [Pleurotus ostreatoroseus]|nr:hypothetical protein EIP86_005225 [Pleurotus ostreatoroseus]